MRVAIQSVMWGQRPRDIPGMLREIRDGGYEGVELWQHPTVLRRASDLFSTLRELRLCIVGVAGGSQLERMKYLREVVAAENLALARDKGDWPRVANFPGGKKPYIHVRQWERDGALEAAASRFTLALHPHMFKPVQTADEAKKLLQEHPELRFLPDVGHLAVAAEDIILVLSDTFDRIEAVHLKDWTAEYGWAYPSYARGFTELGRGQIDLHEVLEFLKSRHYKGWIVVDQVVSRDPAQSARISRAWLQNEHGL